MTTVTCSPSCASGRDEPIVQPRITPIATMTMTIRMTSARAKGRERRVDATAPPALCAWAWACLGLLPDGAELRTRLLSGISFLSFIGVTRIKPRLQHQARCHHINFSPHRLLIETLLAQYPLGLAGREPLVGK